MKMNILEFIDFGKVNTLLEGFNQTTGFVTAILDLDGNVLSKSGWRDICTEFHRINPETAKRCTISDTALANKMRGGEKYHFYQCLNGLVDVAVPLIIRERHVANLFTGQFFFEKPDISFFKKQAEKYGFDERSYLKALEKVPIIPQENVKTAMNFLLNMTEMISEMTFQKLEQIELNEQRRKNEVALLHSEEDLKASQRIAHVGSWRLELESGHVVWSDELYKMYDLDPSLPPPPFKEHHKLFTPESWTRLSKALDNTINTGTHYELELETVRKDESRGWMWVRGESVKDVSGSIVGLRGVSQDISMRKKAEAEQEKLKAQLLQAQKMESVGRLAGGVAHDFNNMLTIILGNTEIIMEESQLSDSHSDYLKEIYKAAEHSADLTKQLLTFARKQIIDPKVLNLNDVVGEMLKMLRRLIGEDIELNWLPADDLESVRMDPSQVDQILANLCINARDAIKNIGKVTIETDNISIDEQYCIGTIDAIPGDYVMISVTDNGLGMDNATMLNIFEPFFTTKNVDKGSGLGLATVFGIVKQNKGFIHVYSEPGYGSTFKIYLPQYHEAELPRQDKVIRADSFYGKETILLVEDEPSILKLTKMMLKRLGYNILSASKPSEAIKIASESSSVIDMLITDVVMPDMNGRDLAKALTRLFPDLKCLFMSGYTANVIAHHGVLDSGVQFINKPFSKESLARKVREVLDIQKHVDRE